MDMKSETYKLFVSVESGAISAEHAQIALLELFNARDRALPNIYSGEDLHTVPLGLYEIFWKDGGSSLASVGNLHEGVRWIAPINWTHQECPTGRMDKHALGIEKMVLLYTK